jgi:tRNA (adenine57-N1/adenine58-N1)-methyltransferase catalytic subunit
MLVDTQPSTEIQRPSDSDASIPAPTPTPVAASTNIHLSKALPEVRGHTSYLTFAILLPPHPKFKTTTSEPDSAVGTPAEPNDITVRTEEGEQVITEPSTTA